MYNRTGPTEHVFGLLMNSSAVSASRSEMNMSNIVAELPLKLGIVQRIP